MKKIFAGMVVVFLIATTGCAKKEAAKPAPNLTRVASHEGAKVTILEPADGASVTSPVTIKFGIEGAELAPAGVVKENSGHHHLLIDMETLPPLDQPLPFNEHVMHFGHAQTQAVINLAPGPHTLQLILAAGNHIPHNPPVMSPKVNIVVK